MGICSWIFFGFLAGLVARAITPGEQRMGFLKTMLLGVAGSFVGGFLSALVFGGDPMKLQASGFVGAVGGAIVLLLLFSVLGPRRV